MEEPLKSDAPIHPAVFESIVRQTPEAIVFADRQGVIRVWNAGAQTLFGFSAAEAIGQSLDIIIPERFRERHWVGYHKAIEDGHTHDNGIRTTRSAHKDGRKLYVALSFAVVADENGDIIGSVAVGRDQTSQFQAKQAP